MGIFSKEHALRRKNYSNKIPVKLVEPSTGRIVEFEVTDSDENTAKQYMSDLESYAKIITKYGAQYNITGKKIRIEYPHSDMADSSRQMWKKSL